MNAGAGDAEDRIARRDCQRQKPIAFGGAHRESGKVVLAVVVHARHLRRLAAHQGAAGLAAAFGDPGDHRARLRHRELAGGEIVEEKQRLGAGNDEVIDAHRDKVDPDRVVQAGVDRDLELGPDPIGGRDQHGVGKTGGSQVEQRAEAAEAPHHARSPGGTRQRLDRLDQCVAGRYVDAGSAIGEAVGVNILGHAASCGGALWGEPCFGAKLC